MAKRRVVKMTEEDLAAIIERRKATGLNYSEGTLATRRIEGLKRYLGKPYGDEKAGHSKVTTRQCLEAVEWTLPSLLRVFMASLRIVEFDPVGSEDEAGAKQESDVLNHIFWKKNNGFMTLYTWIKDTLMNPVGYIKVYWDVRKKVTTERYKGLTLDELEGLLDREDVEVTAYDEETQIVQGPTGPQEVSSFDVEIKLTKENGRVVIEPVPPEELIIDDKLGEVSLEKADFVGHTTHPTRSELIERGFDEDKVYDLPIYNAEINSETSARKESTEGQVGYNEVNDPSTEQVEVIEAYLNVDFDGTGVAQYRRVLMGAGTKLILENEEADMLPFVAMASVPIPHKHAGLSWMELVIDIQKIYTVLTRQLLNNMYRTNNPRPVVGRGVNMSDLLNDSLHAPIRARNVDQLRIEPTQSIIGQVLPAFTMLDEMGERRNGVSKTTMGLDADALSRVTKGAFLGSLEQANQRLEALARIIAESGVKRLFLKIHQLTLTHQEETFEAKVNGTWVNVDPSEWRERDDMTVVVGLGTGNKQAQMMALQEVQKNQMELLKLNKEDMVSDQNLYNTSEKLIEVVGLHNADRYYTNPATQPPKQPVPPAPDPLMESVKVEAENNKMKHQREMLSLKQKADDAVKKVQVLVQKIVSDAKLKDRDLDIKEGIALLNSELEQTRIDMQNWGDLEQAQADFEKGTANER